MPLVLQSCALSALLTLCCVHSQAQSVYLPTVPPLGVAGQSFPLPKSLASLVKLNDQLIIGGVSVVVTDDPVTGGLRVSLPRQFAGRLSVILPGNIRFSPGLDVLPATAKRGSLLTVINAVSGESDEVKKARAREKLSAAFDILARRPNTSSAVIAEQLNSSLNDNLFNFHLPVRGEIYFQKLAPNNLPSRIFELPNLPQGNIFTTDFGQIPPMVDRSARLPYSLKYIPSVPQLGGVSDVDGIVEVETVYSTLLNYSRPGNSVCGKQLVEVRTDSSEVAVQVGALREDLRAAGFALDPTYTVYPSQATNPVVMALTETEMPAAVREKRAQQAISHTGLTNGSLWRGKGVTAVIIDTGGPGIDQYRSGAQTSKYRYPEDQPRGVFATEVLGHGAIVDWVIRRLVPDTRLLHVVACPGGECSLARVIAGLCDAAQEAAGSDGTDLRPVIVNLSLHSTTDSILLRSALADVTRAGVWVVASYGNRDPEGVTCDDQQPNIPCRAYPADWLTPDAMQKEFGGRVLSVGGWLNALGNQKFNRPAPYNRQTPGSGVGPSIYAQGNFWTAYNLTSQGANTLRPYAGTSFAAPVVTAALALWLSPDCPKGDMPPQWPPRDLDDPSQPPVQPLTLDWMWRTNCS